MHELKFFNFHANMILQIQESLTSMTGELIRYVKV